MGGVVGRWEGGAGRGGWDELEGLASGPCSRACLLLGEGWAQAGGRSWQLRALTGAQGRRQAEDLEKTLSL